MVNAQAKGDAPEPIAFDDAALVDRSRRGDMNAFALLAAKYQDRLYNMVYRMCGRRADAEELAQEAMVRALERIDQFRGNSGFYTWLFRIAANLVISHRRRAGRIRFQALVSGDDDGQNQAGPLAAMIQGREGAPHDGLHSAEVNLRVAAALEELDDEFRLVVILRDVEDMDYVQIAEVVGIPAGTVKSRLHRARCILREKLADLMP
jgi:RNA polymerase sigma-70 factor (ECF subfamily)